MNRNNLFTKLLNTKSILKHRKIDKPVIIYGAGDLGKLAKNFFDSVGIEVIGVADRNIEKYYSDSFWKRNLLIKEVEEYVKKISMIVVCVGIYPYSSIEEDLKNLGWEDVVSFYDVTDF